MKNIIILLGVLVAMVGCDKVNADPNQLEGTYIGFAHCCGRDTTRVTLYFSDHTYHSEYATNFSPTVDNGTFDQQNQLIEFKNAVQKENDPHKEVMLNGEYHYQVNMDGTIRIWREDNDHLDECILMHAADETMASVVQ